MKWFAFLVLFLIAQAFVFACGHPVSPEPKVIETVSPLSVAANDAGSAVVDSGADVTMQAPPIRLRYRGTNLSGAEFGTKIPGVHGTDYKWPSSSDVDYFADRGFNILRVPFLHERIQPKLQTDLDTAEWARMKALIDYATGKGLVVELEAHNGFRFNGASVSEVQIGDLWGRIAARLKDNTRVWINPTNEPHDMSTETVLALDAAALKEIRRVGFRGVYVAPGNAFTGAMHWTSTWYGKSNADALLGLTDPNAETAFEVHLYFDADESGAGKECVSATIGVERMRAFVEWLRRNHRLGVVGEIGAPNTPTCKAAVTNALAFIESSYDVILAWSWWSAGVWSYGATGSYPLTIGPTASAAPERAQMGWLKSFLPCNVKPDGGI